MTTIMPSPFSSMPFAPSVGAPPPVYPHPFQNGQPPAVPTTQNSGFGAASQEIGPFTDHTFSPLWTYPFGTMY
jgi:hypothetical protein